MASWVLLSSLGLFSLFAILYIVLNLKRVGTLE